MSARRRAQLVLLASLAAAVVVAGDAPAWLRGPVVIGFVLVCPGGALVALLRLGDRVAELSLAVAVSLALAILVPAATLYAGAWSPTLALAILIALTAAVTSFELRRSTE